MFAKHTPHLSMGGKPIGKWPLVILAAFLRTVVRRREKRCGRRQTSGSIATHVGSIFETYLLHEVRAFLAYTERPYPLHFFRTHDDVEVDLLCESARGMIAIELDSSPRRRGEYDKGFRRIRAEIPDVRCIGVNAGERRMAHDGVDVYPYPEFLKAMWQDELFT